MMTWFRLYHDTPDDIKLRRFTPQEKWAWIALLCLASKSGDRGSILAQDEDIADYCEFNSTQDWLYYRDKLIAKGMLEISGAGTLSILHWNERQYDKPSSTPEATKERKRRQREREKESKALDVTPMSRDVTPSHATDTDTDPDTDPDPDPNTHSLSERQSEPEKSESGFVSLTEPEPAIARVTTPLEHSFVNSTEEAVVGDLFPASVSLPVENSSRYLSGVEKVERHFTAPQLPWGRYLNPEPAFLDYLLRIYLPKVPSNRGVDLALSDARRWLNKAKFDEQRRDDALIEWQSFIDWRSRQVAPSVAEQPPTIATADNPTRVETLNGLLRAGRLESVERAIAENPQWELEIKNNEVVCTKLSA